MNIKIKKLKLFLNLVLLFFLFFFVFLYIAPFGNISYKKDFQKKINNIFLAKGHIYKLGPADRVHNKNKIIAEPAYFYLRTPRSFDSARLKIKYKISEKSLANGRLINVQAGVLLNKDSWSYSLGPIYNNALNLAIEDWAYDKEGDTVFLQKDKKFENLDNFLNKKDFSSLAVYNYKLSNNYLIDKYTKKEDYSFSTPSLLGSHVFYTYLKDENLKFDFLFENIDKNNKNNLDIFVYSENNIIFSKSFDSGQFKDGKSLNFSLDLPYLPEGVYRVEIRANNSFIIKSIKSYLDKISFLNKVSLYNTSNGFQVFSNKSNFKIKVLDAQCLGQISINNQSFLLDEIYRQFSLDLPFQEFNSIKSNSCGLLIENNGLFSFEKESLFNPLISSIESLVDLDSFSFIIANYDPPKREGEYYFSELDIDLKNAWREDDEYRFIISAPFLNGLDLNEYLEIKEIEIKLSGKSLKTKILDLFNHKN